MDSANTINPTCECRTWHAAAVDINDEIANLIPCPTTFAQAREDSRFQEVCYSSGVYSPRDDKTLPSVYGATTGKLLIIY